eukprot:306308-Rhodomonas_salina.2
MSGGGHRILVAGGSTSGRDIASPTKTNGRDLTSQTRHRARVGPHRVGKTRHLRQSGRAYPVSGPGIA